MKNIYIDVETGGLDPKVNPILQLSGSIEIDGEIMESFDYFMQPFRGEMLVDEALAVTGMTVEQIKTFPKPAVVYEQFIDLLDKYINKWDKNDKFYFIAFNSDFDESHVREWLIKNAKTEKDKKYGNFYGSYVANPSICVLKMAAMYLRDERHKLSNLKLKTVYEYLFPDGEITEWHNSAADIKATRDIFKHIINNPKTT